METWRNAPDDVRSACAAQAEAENEDVEQVGFLEFVAREAGGQHRKARCLTAKRAAVQRTLRQLQTHPCYSAGAGIMTYGCGLRADKVRLGSADRMAEECGKLFDFDCREHENPKGGLSFFTPCSSRNGGVCQQEQFAARSRHGSRNLAQLLREKKRPLLLRFTVPDASSPEPQAPLQEYHYLLKSFDYGGEHLSLLMLKCAQTADGYLPLPADVGLGTSHTVIRRLCRASLELLGETPSELRIEVLHRDFANLPKCVAEEPKLLVAAHARAGFQTISLEHVQKPPTPPSGSDVIHLPFGATIDKADVYPVGPAVPHLGQVEGQAADEAFDDESDVAGIHWELSDDNMSCSGSEVSEEVDLDPPGPRGPDPLPRPALPVSLEVGLQYPEVAPTNRRQCVLCKEMIPLNATSWRHRLRPTLHPKDNRFIHEGCIPRLPESSKDRDIALLERLLDESPIGGFQCVAAGTALALRRG